MSSCKEMKKDKNFLMAEHRIISITYHCHNYKGFDNLLLLSNMAIVESDGSFHVTPFPVRNIIMSEFW